MKPCIVIGHRGAMGYEPENTLRSFEKAIELGVDGIELDVYLIRNELLVFHDDRLERTTNGTGYLSDKTVEEIRSLDAGKGERVPFLSEVLELVRGRCRVNIELKGWGTAGPVASLLNGFLNRAEWSTHKFLISSFKHRELLDFKSIQPGIRVGALIEGALVDHARFATQLGAYSVHVSLEHTDRALIADAHSRGLKIFAYTVNDPERLAFAQMLGVDGVFSDFPDRLLNGDCRLVSPSMW